MSAVRTLIINCVLFTAGSAFGADSTCMFLADANARIYAMPAHLYQTEKAAYTGGKTRTTELIYLNNKIYIMVGGKWILSKETPQSMAEIQKEATKAESNMKCAKVHDEPVNGEAATLYSAHRETPDGKTDSQIWISKSKGVPVKMEMDMDVGGAAGKSHRSIRYDYTNVQAPAGVH